MKGKIYRVTYNAVKQVAELHMDDGEINCVSMTDDEWKKMIQGDVISNFNKLLDKKYIIVGAGASGKDWLLQKMKELGYNAMKQYTTREIRDNETGDEYHFVSEDEFKKIESEGKFISVNFYRIGWYGVSYDELLNSDVAILSPANVKDVFEKHPDVRDRFTIIYLDIPEEVRRERLAKRYTDKVGDDNEIRLANDRKDFNGFIIWDLCLESEKMVDDYINKLSPKLK